MMTIRKKIAALAVAVVAVTFLSACETNTAPHAQAEMYSMYTTDEALVVGGSGVLENDSDEDGDLLTASLVTAPVFHSGDFSLSGNGSFRYEFDGTQGVTSDSFDYRVYDGDKHSRVVTGTITIVKNTRPAPMADAYALDSGQSDLTVAAAEGVLLNDSDAEADTMIVSLVEGPSHANGFNLTAQGGFQYSAAKDGALEDSFTYRLSDGKSESEVVTVALALNEAPSAVSSCERVDPAVTVYGNLVSQVSDDDFSSLVFTVDTAPTQGVLQLSEGGSFSYSTGLNSQGFLDSFSYTVTDLLGTTVSATQTLQYGVPRIMPLGDSLTRGTTGVPVEGSVDLPVNNFAIGYRKRLQELLTTEGYVYDFVGSQQFGFSAGIVDADNEGHLGWSAWQMLNGTGGGEVAPIVTFLDANPADVMLLFVGTNDQNSNAFLVEGLMDQVAAWQSVGGNNAVQMVVANVIPQSLEETPDFSKENAVAAWNNNLATILAKPKWSNVVSVDVHAAIDPDTDITAVAEDFTGLHLTQGGYDKIAAVWFDGIHQAGLLSKCSR